MKNLYPEVGDSGLQKYPVSQANSDFNQYFKVQVLKSGRNGNKE